MIILKENEWAAEMIKSHTLGKKPAETLRRVARYYLDNGYGVSETRRKLDEFMLRCDSDVSLPLWSDLLDRSVRAACHTKAADIEYIGITRSEMTKIESVQSRPAQRLAFTLLCLSKYFMSVYPACDHWVSTPNNEIMKMADVSTSLKRQSQLYRILRDADMIKFSKKVGNTNVQVTFCDEDESDIVLKVSDFRNLGYRYLMYHGEPYFECANCGIITKIRNPKNSRGQKYCRDCAVEVATKQKVNYAMRKSRK